MRLLSLHAKTALSVASYRQKNKSPGKVNCRGVVAMATPLVDYHSCLQGVSEGVVVVVGGGVERQILCVNYSKVITVCYSSECCKPTHKSRQDAHRHRHIYYPAHKIICTQSDAQTWTHAPTLMSKVLGKVHTCTHTLKHTYKSAHANMHIHLIIHSSN